MDAAAAPDYICDQFFIIQNEEESLAVTKIMVEVIDSAGGSPEYSGVWFCHEDLYNLLLSLVIDGDLFGLITTHRTDCLLLGVIILDGADAVGAYFMLTRKNHRFQKNLLAILATL